MPAVQTLYLTCFIMTASEPLELSHVQACVGGHVGLLINITTHSVTFL